MSACGSARDSASELSDFDVNEFDPKFILKELLRIKKFKNEEDDEDENENVED